MAQIKMKIDFSDSIKEKFKTTLENELNKDVINALDNTVEDLKRVTPKRTGYAASRWDSSIDEKYNISISLKNAFIFAIKKELQYTIKNDAEYISFLNEGSSQQAPAYFVEQTLLKNGFVPTF